MDPINDLAHGDRSTLANAAQTQQQHAVADHLLKKELSAKSTTASMSTAPEPELYEKAYRRFNFDFITPFPGALSRLPQLLFASPPDSCLCSAVAAVAYANFYGRCRSIEAKEAGIVYYGKTLEKFATVMADPVEVQRDDTLMVIFLMSMYEMFTSSTPDGSYLAHMLGTQSVLAHRDRTTLQDGNNHLALLCTHLVVWYLTDLKLPPPDLASWIEQIPFDSSIKKQLTSLIAKTAVACAKLDELSKCDVGTQRSPDLGNSGLGALQEALYTDDRLQQWTTTDMPLDWKQFERKPLSHANRPEWSQRLFMAPGTPDHIRIYSNHLPASDWNMCRAARIRLWMQVFTFLDQCAPAGVDVAALRQRSLDTIITLADEIAETIPYSINLSPDGDADPKSPEDIPGIFAYSILWSTFSSFVAYRSLATKLQPTRAPWFGAMLRFLRDTAGIAKVEVFFHGWKPENQNNE